MEEEIKILEEHIEFLKRNDVEDIFGDMIGEILAIENLIKGYRDSEDIMKNAVKENLELKEYIRELEEERDNYKGCFIVAMENSIPKSKAKEKIEELNKEEKKALKGTKGQDRYSIKLEYMYKRNALQELLEESEK